MKYNDEFDDIFDEDEELEDIPGIDELLEAHDMNIETAAKRCDEYMSEFDGFIKRIGSASDKFGICEKLAVMLERHETDSADLPWCYAVLSSFADFLFREEDDDEVRITSYLKLTDEVEFRMRCCKEQASAVKEFDSIISDITRSEETVGEIDFRLLQRTVYNLGFRGEQLENNLRMLTDIITHSKELYRIAPLIYYSALMRNTKKMQSKEDYEPNISALLRRMEYGIDTDNGKNIPVLEKHLNVITTLVDVIGGDDVWLCLMGFDRICNIMQCDLLDWENMSILRPIRDQIMDDVFSVFVGGAADNPFYTDFDEYLSEHIYIEEKYPSFAESIDSFTETDDTAVEKYEELLRNGSGEKALSAINIAIDGAGVLITDIDAKDSMAAYSYVMAKIMERTDYRIHRRLADAVLGYIPDV